MARPVVNRPKTKNGCALAWYCTSFLMGSGMKYLYWKKICNTKTAQVRIGALQIAISHRRMDIQEDVGPSQTATVSVGIAECLLVAI